MVAHHRAASVGIRVSGTTITRNGVTWQPRGGAVPVWAANTASTARQAINLVLNCGADVIRFTDFLDIHTTAGVGEYDEAHWVSLDRLIAYAGGAGLPVEFDVAAYRNLLEAQSTTANAYTVDWTPFLTFAANRINTISGQTYKTDPAINFISFAGETLPPSYADSVARGITVQNLIDFYNNVMTTWGTLAPGQIRIPGGLFHFDANLPWQQIFSLASCDLPALHSYSGADETGEATTHAYVNGLGKPWLLEEFGIVKANYANDGARATDFTRQYTVATGNSAAGVLMWGMDITALDPVLDPLTLTAIRGVSNVAHTGTYRYFKCAVTAVRTPGSACQIAEWTLFNGATSVAGMLVTATNNAGASYESPVCAADLDVTSKWNNTNGVPTTLTYDFGFTTTVTGYRFTTANDNSGRDPAAWTVSGSPDGTTWTTLDTKTGQLLPTARNTAGTTYPISG